MSDNCKERVPVGGRSVSLRQCARKAKRDGYCNQHHPEAVKEREDEAVRRWEEKRKSSAPVLLDDAKKKIAELEAQLSRLTGEQADTVQVSREDLKDLWDSWNEGSGFKSVEAWERIEDLLEQEGGDE